MKRKFLTYSTIVLLCISLSLLVSCKDAKLINEKTAASHKTKKELSTKVNIEYSKHTSKNKKTNKKQYTIVFKDEKGKVLSKQTVNKKGSAVVPETPKKKGCYFYSWNRSTDNITDDLVITPVFLKEGTVPQIEISKATVKSGTKNVEVTVSVKNNPGVASIALDLLFDKSKLKLKDFSYNNDALKGALTVPFNKKSDPPCLSMVNSYENITGDFEFAKLEFEILKNAKGSYPITLYCDKENVYNIDESNVGFELVNGLITIK